MKVLLLLAFSSFLAGTTAGTVPDRCNNCQSIINNVQVNFHNASQEHTYHNFQQVCGQMGNLNNACKKINEAFFNDIYKHVETSLVPNDFCFKTGECGTNVLVPIIQIAKSIPTGEQEDPACELCKELVKHLVTELTEDDFHKILVDGCKALDSSETACKEIADEYYPLLHDYLVDKLNVKAVCSFVGICPGPGLFGAAIPIPSVNTIPKVVPTVKPVPVPVPVRPSTSIQVQRSSIFDGPLFAHTPQFNIQPSAGILSLAPLAALPAFAPLLALG